MKLGEGKEFPCKYMMDYKKENIERLRQYFMDGCKDLSKPLTMGLELEHFIVKKDTKESVSYYGECGVEALLKRLMPNYSQSAYSEGHLIGLGREDLAVSIEPAAQLEVSISPQVDGRRIQQIYDQFLAEITPILLEWGYELVTVGYQPKSKVEELDLIPKNRYRFMKDYFDKISPYGQYMMKGTAATQVSIDYYSEEDFSNKYKIAYALYPILALLCDNMVYFEGEENKESVMRMKIWDHVDNARVEVEPYLNEGSIDFKSYAEFVYSTPLIVQKEKEGDIATTKSASELYANRLISTEDIEHILSMVFPIIRLKHYLELRVADSMPLGSVYAYLLLIKGLFADITRVKNYVDELVLNHPNWTKELLTVIRAEGIDGQLYHHKVRDIVIDLYGMILGNLNDPEVAYLEEYKKGIINKGSLLL